MVENRTTPEQTIRISFRWKGAHGEKAKINVFDLLTPNKSRNDERSFETFLPAFL